MADRQGTQHTDKMTWLTHDERELNVPGNCVSQPPPSGLLSVYSLGPDITIYLRFKY